MSWATWNGAVIAESNRTTLVEGSHDFPIGDVSTELPVDSEKLALCMRKGTASCNSAAADGHVNIDAPWTHPNPTTEAREMEDRIALWRGVQVHEMDEPIDHAVQER